ncbi:MAG: protein kinase [Symploca sp. SIO2E6]|nr:protein kinase [Symploca sp. SIO2E6]
MSYCVTPGCFTPINPDSALYCRSCGAQLLLRQRYRGMSPIGSGGFGRTFLAVDEDIPGKPSCVIKQFAFPSRGGSILNKAGELFRQEAERLEQLGEHPQIPKLLAYFEQNKQLYLVQELIEGQNLEEALQQVGQFGEKQIWELLRNLLPVLQYIHDRQVIHRDIKPANIIHRPSDHQSVLIDFGVAKLLSNTALQQTGTMVGTVEYMAPEQIKGKAFPASDLYSLGVSCIHLLTGIPPADMFDIMHNRWAWRHHLPGGKVVSDRLGCILDKLLENTLSERYQSAHEVLQAVHSQPTVAKSVIPQTSTQALASELESPSIFRNRVSRDYDQENSAFPQQKPGFLTNDQGIDYRVHYSGLRDLLARKKWQEADNQTWDLLCQALGRRPGYYLQTADIKNLPCQDLLLIDQLWHKYSEGRFSFTVQKQIYEEVAGDYPSFCDRVGWPLHNSNTLQSRSSFKLRLPFTQTPPMPVGHFPSRQWAGGYYWWRHAGTLAAKLEQCSIVAL